MPQRRKLIRRKNRRPPGRSDWTNFDENQIGKIIQKIKTEEICGINITVPFKQAVIPFLETRSEVVTKTNSVNTVLYRDGKIHGENTDVYGFEKSITNKNINLEGKSALIFGAGGVVSSIIFALVNLKIKKIFISNRTLENAKNIKNRFSFVEIIKWGEIENCDLIINSTSVGLKVDDKFELDLDKFKKNKIFYDVIYNPSKTNFLQEAEKRGHEIINGRDMFLFQAQKAFSLWHDLTPKIDKKLIKYLYND